MSLQESKKITAAIFVLIIAAFAIFAACPAHAATMSLWNGDIKKGDVTIRTSGTAREAAIDEVVKALGLIPAQKDSSSVIVSLDGKKIEFWVGSNIVRAAGSIISLQTPIEYADGHCWGEYRGVAEAFGHFFAAIGMPAKFTWREGASAPAGATTSQKVAAQMTAAKAAQNSQKTQRAQAPAKTETRAQSAQPAAKSATAQKAAEKTVAAPSPAATKAAAPAKAPTVKPFTGNKKPIVVVDAGHGGHDPGAMANKIREKDINLRAALQLAEILRGYGVDVRLSRSTDVYLKLAERTAFANNNNADVFVSLHCNSMPKGHSGVSGLEYYIMASPSDKDALNLAIAENKEISGSAETAADVQKADKKTQLLLKILGDMQQNDKITESTTLVEVMHKAAKSASMPIRKVAQAPFFVLRGAGMPAVLVEMGYLTNAGDASKLNSASYRNKLCTTIAKGVVQYITEHPTQR